MQVLIVEDDKSIRDLLAQVVEMFGYTPFTASDIESATKILSYVRPAVILLDLLLTGSMSTPFIDAAKQLMNGNKVEIIVLSAMRGAEKIAHAHQVDFLAKPFDVEKLHEMLDLAASVQT